MSPTIFDHRAGRSFARPRWAWAARLRGRAIGSVCLLTLVPASAPAAGAVELAAEGAAKASFIYRLMKFVEWPISVRAKNGEPLHLCVWGNDKVFEGLTAVSQGQRAQDRPLVVRRADKATLAGCDAIFVGARVHRRFSSAPPPVGPEPVLTIGETQGFAELGGMVNLVWDDGHLRLEVNRRVLREAGLQISALVLSLATIIE